jgi:SM-20-related protein
MLSRVELVTLVERIIEMESRFITATQVAPAAEPGRFETGRSAVLTDLGALRAPLERRIRQILPEALGRLGLPEFGAGRMEAQITATNDGESLAFRSAPRGAKLTFVLWFHRDPKMFEGGDLRIHYGRGRRGTSKIVPGQQGMLVMFPSGYKHEITTVRAPSRAFANGLFTITGWLLS